MAVEAGARDACSCDYLGDRPIFSITKVCGVDQFRRIDDAGVSFRSPLHSMSEVLCTPDSARYRRLALVLGPVISRVAMSFWRWRLHATSEITCTRRPPLSQTCPFEVTSMLQGAVALRSGLGSLPDGMTSRACVV